MSGLNKRVPDGRPVFRLRFDVSPIRLPTNVDRRRTDGRRSGRGHRIRVVGRVPDGESQPVPDAMIEIWQADAQGRFAHSADPGGRTPPLRGSAGWARNRPRGAVHFRDDQAGRAVRGRGAIYLGGGLHAGPSTHVYTRIYFPDEAERNAAILSYRPCQRSAATH